MIKNQKGLACRQAGFTLIELLVVIAILSFIVVAALVTINPVGQFGKARDAKRKEDLSSIQKALEAYTQDHNGKYPTSNGTYNIVDAQSGAITWGSAWGNYMTILPKDPGAGKVYRYYTNNNGISYYLYANLDNSTDPQICSGGGTCPHVPGGVTCDVNNAAGKNLCNYGVTSSDVTP